MKVTTNNYAHPYGTHVLASPRLVSKGHSESQTFAETSSFFAPSTFLKTRNSGGETTQKMLVFVQGHLQDPSLTLEPTLIYSRAVIKLIIDIWDSMALKFSLFIRGSNQNTS